MSDETVKTILEFELPDIGESQKKIDKIDNKVSSIDGKMESIMLFCNRK